VRVRGFIKVNANGELVIGKDILRQVLSEQHRIILQRLEGIEREVLTQLGEKTKLPHVIIITGVRRCGKSTLMRQVIKRYYHDAAFFYVNFEDERLVNFQAEDFNQIYETLVELFGPQKTFFIDEIQNVEGFERFVRRFAEEGFKFYITGSNAKLLSRELGTILTGRHVNVLLKPFSFREYLQTKKVAFDPARLLITTDRADVKKAFEEYLLNGGMPEHVLFHDPDILVHIYDDIVLKDIAVRYHITNLRALREIYSYLISNVGQKFSYNNLAKLVHVNSANTIKKYIEYLEGTYLGCMVEKFDYSVKKQLMNDKKLYILDNGFIPRISRKAMQDRGWLLENVVFTVLFGTGQVFYYATKRECDFLLVKENKIGQAIQVCYELSETNRNRELQGLVDCMTQCNLLEGYLLTYDQQEEIATGGKLVHVIPVWKWMLEK